MLLCRSSIAGAVYVASQGIWVRNSFNLGLVAEAVSIPSCRLWLSLVKGEMNAYP